MAASGVPSDDRDQREDMGNPAPSEQSPLLPSDNTQHSRTVQNQPRRESGASSRLRSNIFENGSRKKRRWPSLVALLLLCIVAALIMVFAFITPSVVEQYASEAAVFEPTSLSIAAITVSGVQARVQGTFKMDAGRVHKSAVRNLGIFGTWIARQVESGESEVEVSLPEYGNVVLGTATVPGIRIDVRNGHETPVDFIANLRPGDLDGVRRVAKDWIDGRLGQLRLVGTAHVPLASGLLQLGTQIISHEILFVNDEIPAIPEYQIKRLNFKEVDTSAGKAMAAEVFISAQNDYPVDFTVPPLGFALFVDGCQATDPHIMIADATTQDVVVRPSQKVTLNVTGLVRELPPILTQDCPDTGKSPLDNLLAKYMQGKNSTVYVTGATAPSPDTPKWVTEIMSDLSVAVPLPGHSFGHMIKNFTFTDSHFSLPDPFAEPGAPDSYPLISANVRALVTLPEEMNFHLDVSRVRADADVFYKGQKLGQLDLNQWQAASSHRIEPHNNEGAALAVESVVKDAPLYITDEDLFADAIQDLIFKGKTIAVRIKAKVDVAVKTAVGDFVVRQIPAQGDVPVNPLPPPSRPPHTPGEPSKPPSPPMHGNLTSLFKPRLDDLRIINSTSASLTLGALVNLTNPTVYAATIPYVDIEISKNGSVIGHAVARNLTVNPGFNARLSASARYDPLSFGGDTAKAVGRELISQYISGWNTTFTIRLHENSIPHQPLLGRALGRFPIEIPAPKLGLPDAPPDGGGHDGDGDGSDESPRFLRGATMHLFSSTATFILASPLQHNTLFITSIAAKAMYHGDVVGRIAYDQDDDDASGPLPIPPLKDTPGGRGYETPRLPVDWHLGSVGYDAVRRALGGTLKLEAAADVGVSLGQWSETLWFQGNGVGARIVL